MPPYDPNSIVDLLKSQGKDPSLASRAQLAVQNNLATTPEEYISKANAGTNADINTQLINLLKGGAKSGQSSGSMASPNANVNANSATGGALPAPGATSPAPAGNQPTGANPATGSQSEQVNSLVYPGMPSVKTPEEIRNEANSQNPYAGVEEAGRRQNEIYQQKELAQFDISAKHNKDLLLNSLAARGILGNSSESNRLIKEQTESDNAKRALILDKYNVMNQNLSADVKQKTLDFIQKEIERRDKEEQTKIENWKTALEAAQTMSSENRASRQQVLDEEYRTKQLTLDQQKAEADKAYNEKRISLDEYQNETARLKLASDELLANKRLEVDWFNAETSRGKAGDDGLLSISDAKALGVPYGTTKAQAAAMGIVPDSNKVESDPKIISDKVALIDTLLTHKGLDSRVGPNPASRRQYAIKDSFGSGQDFAGGVQQLASKEFIDTLVSAKASGATFGALNEQEGAALRAAASKINAWEVWKKANKNGQLEEVLPGTEGANPAGEWNVDEASFKKELNTIKTLAERALEKSGGTTGGVLRSPDGTQEVSVSDLTQAEIAEAKKAGWK